MKSKITLFVAIVAIPILMVSCKKEPTPVSKNNFFYIPQEAYINTVVKTNETYYYPAVDKYLDVTVWNINTTQFVITKIPDDAVNIKFQVEYNGIVEDAYYGKMSSQYPNSYRFTHFTQLHFDGQIVGYQCNYIQWNGSVDIDYTTMPKTYRFT